MPLEQLLVLLGFLAYSLFQWIMRNRRARDPVDGVEPTWDPPLEERAVPPPWYPAPEPPPPSIPRPVFEPEPPPMRETQTARPAPAAPVVERSLRRTAHAAEGTAARAGSRARQALHLVPGDKVALRRAMALMIVLGPPRALQPPEEN